MPARKVVDRLRAGELLLLDGATGSELQRRGLNLSTGAASGKLTAWSATANIDSPEIVRAVHEDYLHLGVDILTSNNFWTGRERLGLIGLGDRWEAYAQAAAEIAIEARDRVNPDAYVAAGIAPPYFRHEHPEFDGSRYSEDVQASYREQAELVAKLGVDLILAEYLTNVEDCAAAADASAEAGLPVFLGISTYLGAIDLEQLGRTLEGHPVDAILLMCTWPEEISSYLPGLRAVYDGPIGAYANIGYHANPKFGSTSEPHWHEITEDSERAYRPERYAEFAAEWVAAGAQIVGGCCGTTPEHIEALSPVLAAAGRASGSVGSDPIVTESG
jgi:S-methylmethionine-dependent homocysteine/selenocysteine methylase